MCVFLWRKRERKEQRERERELFFADLNFFFRFPPFFFSVLFSPTTPRKSFSPFLAFSFHFFHQKNDESLTLKNEDQTSFL